jgi:hypothetical protein
MENCRKLFIRATKKGRDNCRKLFRIALKVMDNCRKLFRRLQKRQGQLQVIQESYK